MASDPAPTPPRRVVRLGKYEVLAHVATGGMGSVYRARDTETDAEVALKVLNAEMAANKRMITRFRREARHAAKLRHEHIVSLYDFDEYKGTCFLVMEFVDGADLHDYVRREGPLDPEEARRLVLQAARALRHAHEQNIVHRDVKPSNFLVARKNGRPFLKLTDLGLAREVNNDEHRVTRAGHTVGTLDYMAPEQARDSGLADVRSDLFSLGATWYHLLAGQAPFPEGGLGERLFKIMNEEPPDVRDLNPRVSAAGWAVLRRLMAKDPADRYQTPADLIDDLLGLEGKANARSEERRAREPRRGPKPRGRHTPRSRPSAPAGAGDKRLWLAAAAATALVLLVGIGAVLATRGRGEPPPTDQAAGDPPDGPNPGTKPPVEDPPKPPEKNGPILKVVPPPPPPPPRWAALYKPSAPIDVKALREEVGAPWAKAAPAADAFVARVSRAGPHTTLAAACAAAPEGKPIVVEIDDNGPLYETGAAVRGRDLTVRAGKGYRPLLVWDVALELAGRKRARKPGAVIDDPLSLLEVEGGRLTLQGLDVVCRWPEAASGEGSVLAVKDGDLQVSDCTFSVAGRRRDGIPVAGLRGAPEGGAARCRFTRCHARGASLVALALEAPGAEVLFDGCLLAGGEPPLLRLRVDEKKGATVRAVRTTAVCANTLVELHPAAKGDRSPALRWLGWDALLSRSGDGAGGELLRVAGGADALGVDWRATNCLYAGWRALLAGPKTIAGGELARWQELWKRVEGDGVAAETWPEQAVSEPATEPAASYLPGGKVGFAASVDAAQPLGCDLGALPAPRDHWPALAFAPDLSVPEPPSDDAAPAIPADADGRYAGERLDLTDLDLGAYLTQVQRKRKLAARVVLHLAGTGERPMTPVKVTGSTLVLYFEPPAADAAPLALKPAKAGRAAALVEVEGGDLEVVGGELRAADAEGGAVPFVCKVKGGGLRLYRCRLEGPQPTAPAGFAGLVSLEGSGDSSGDKAHACLVNESVLVSGKAGVRLEGVGARLGLRQTLVVAGTDAVQLLPGAACTGRANVHCQLDHVTFAAREAVFRLGDAPKAGVPRDPVVVRARDCAFLHPFLDKGAKPGLLLAEGEALARGLLLWQGERNAFDKRLHFAAGKAAPARAEGPGAWARLWGSPGTRAPRPDLTLRATFDARRWPLERLALPAGRGADFGALGIRKKPRTVG